MLSLERGKYTLDGCLVGIPAAPHAAKEFDASKCIVTL